MHAFNVKLRYSVAIVSMNDIITKEEESLKSNGQNFDDDNIAS